MFDEVHFGKFTNWYMKGEYFFDIHPPLGKLMLALWGTLLGYPADYSFTNIGDPYPTPYYAYLRMVPAFFSALVPPVAYLASDAVGLSEPACLLAAATLLFDNCVVGEGKFILVDSQLFFWSVFTLWCYFRSRKTAKLGRAYYTWLALTGLGVCGTISVKWTGLGLVGVVGIDVLVQLLVDLKDSPLEDWARDFAAKFTLLAVVPLVLYYIIFMIHFILLPKSGSGDAFMSWEFKKRLIGADVPAYVERQGLFVSFFELHKVMFLANEGLSAEHNWGSRWYQWPTMGGKGVLYWTSSNAKIYLMGNPFVWWSTGAAFLGFLGFLLKPVLVEQLKIRHKFAAPGGGRAMPMVQLGSSSSAAASASSASVDASALEAGAAGVTGAAAVLAASEDGPGGPHHGGSGGGVGGGALGLGSMEIDSLFDGGAGSGRQSFVEYRRRQLFVLNGLFFFMGFSANLFPYMMIRRVCFAYHFVPTLIQSAFLGAVVLDYAVPKKGSRWVIAVTLTVLYGFSFWWFSPWTYGFPTSTNLKWRSHWD